MQKRPLETYLDAIQNHHANRRYTLALQETAQGIQSYREVAQLWAYLGASLEQTGFPMEACISYQRAFLLDPQSHWLPDTISRLLKNQGNQKVRDWIHELTSVKKVTVGAAIITKNEERIISETIRHLQPAVDQIVIVDTGSTDDTVSIAKSLGAEVYSFAWQDDFSAARNFALTKISTDWVLSVDADELLFPEDADAVRIVAGIFDDSDTPTLLRVVIENKVHDVITPIYEMTRLFPARFGLRWWGRIHEQVGPDTGGIFSANYARPVVRIRFLHDGYEQSIMESKDKLGRNIRLLRASIEDDPKDVISWGFLGRELFLLGELEEAVSTLLQAERIAQEFPQYGRVQEVQIYLSEALIRLNRMTEAMQVLLRTTESSPDFPSGWYALGTTQMSLGLRYLQEASQSFKNAIDRAPNYHGIVSYDTDVPKWKAHAALADVTKLFSDWVKARKLYLEILRIVPDNETILAAIEQMERQVEQLQKDKKQHSPHRDKKSRK